VQFAHIRGYQRTAPSFENRIPRREPMQENALNVANLDV